MSNRTAPSNQPPTLEPVAVSISQAGALLSLSRATIWNLVRDGRLAKVRVGRRSLIPYASVKALITDRAA